MVCGIETRIYSGIEEAFPDLVIIIYEPLILIWSCQNRKSPPPPGPLLSSFRFIPRSSSPKKNKTNKIVATTEAANSERVYMWWLRTNNASSRVGRFLATQTLRSLETDDVTTLTPNGCGKGAGKTKAGLPFSYSRPAP